MWFLISDASLVLQRPSQSIKRAAGEHLPALHLPDWPPVMDDLTRSLHSPASTDLLNSPAAFDRCAESLDAPTIQ